MPKAKPPASGAPKHTKSKGGSSSVDPYQATLHTVGFSGSRGFKRQSAILPYFTKTPRPLLPSSVALPIASVSLPVFDAEAFKCSLPPDDLALILLELHYISPNW